MKTLEEDRKERLERGAIEVTDGSGGGFAQHEAEFSNPGLETYLKTDPELHRQLLEIEARQHDQRVAQQHQEAYLKMFEENMNQESVRESRWLRQNELRDFVPGEMMTSSHFLAKLRRIRPDAVYNEETVLGRRGLCFKNPRKGHYYFATTVHDGMMIEWSQMRYDEHDIPTNERYHGWRSTLMTLIEKEIISEDECNAVFGRPTGDRANRWYRMLYTLRNSRCPDCLKQICICKKVGESARADKYAFGVQ